MKRKDLFKRYSAVAEDEIQMSLIDLGVDIDLKDFPSDVVEKLDAVFGNVPPKALVGQSPAPIENIETVETVETEADELDSEGTTYSLSQADAILTNESGDTLADATELVFSSKGTKSGLKAVKAFAKARQQVLEIVTEQSIDNAVNQVEEIETEIAQLAIDSSALLEESKKFRDSLTEKRKMLQRKVEKLNIRKKN
jgi:hypothetical protein